MGDLDHQSEGEKEADTSEKYGRQTDKCRRKYTADECGLNGSSYVNPTGMIAPDDVFELQDDALSEPDSPIKIRHRDLDLLHLTQKSHEVDKVRDNTFPGDHFATANIRPRKKGAIKSPSFNTNGFLLG